MAGVVVARCFKTIILAFLGASLFMHLGCAGPTYHTATPTPEDTTSIAVAASVHGFLGPEDEFIQVHPELMLRRGLTPNMDIGFRTSGTITLDLNYAFINDESFALSINPSLNVAFVWFSGTLGLLADVIKTQSTVLTLGLKPGVFFLREPQSSWHDASGYYGIGVSGVVGARLQLGRVRLLPTIEIIAPFEDTERLNFAAGIGLAF